MNLEKDAIIGTAVGYLIDTDDHPLFVRVIEANIHHITPSRRWGSIIHYSQKGRVVQFKTYNGHWHVHSYNGRLYPIETAHELLQKRTARVNRTGETRWIRRGKLWAPAVMTLEGWEVAGYSGTFAKVDEEGPIIERPPELTL